MNKTRHTELLLIGYLATTMATFAAINNWNDPETGSWGVGGNWSGGVPQASDDILIEASGTYTVSVDDATADPALGMAVNSLRVGTVAGMPELAVDFTNALRTLTVGAGTTGTAGTLGVGTVAGTRGTLSIADGHLSAARLYLGEGGGGSHGTARIDGGTLTLRSTDANYWMRLGDTAGSTGTLVVAGGTLISRDADNFGNVGGNGVGMLIVSNGLLETATVHVPGYTRNNEGTILLRGGDWFVRKGTVEIGSGINSLGRLTVDGGNMTGTNGNNHLLIGVRSGSRGIANVRDGKVNVTGSELLVGTRAGSYGELTVEEGGEVFSGKPGTGFRIGGAHADAGGTGVVHVAGGTLIHSAGWTTMGAYANARGFLTVSDGLCELWGSGLIVGDGDGSWSELRVTGGSCVVNGTEPLYLRSGAIIVSNGLFTSPKSTLIGTTGGSAGPKTGILEVSGGTVTVGSTTVGNTDRTGIVRVLGNGATVTMNALAATTVNSHLQFTLGETGVTSLTVTGALTVNANTRLQIDLADYRYMTHDLVVPLISYASRSGAFDVDNITFLNAGPTELSVDMGSGVNDAVTLRITPPPVGTVFLLR